MCTSRSPSQVSVAKTCKEMTPQIMKRSGDDVWPLESAPDADHMPHHVNRSASREPVEEEPLELVANGSPTRSEANLPTPSRAGSSLRQRTPPASESDMSLSSEDEGAQEDRPSRKHHRLDWRASPSTSVEEIEVE